VVPELPEVETVARDLRPHLVGRRIRSIEVSKHALRRPWSKAWEPALLGRRIERVRRRGKWLILELERDLYLVFHLGMSGQLQVMPPRAPRAEHTHIVLGLSPGTQQLRLRDIRRFGSATLFTGSEALERFFVNAKLGPEPAEVDPVSWWKQLTGTRRCLKAALLDQRLVAGVGNIYADESLFEARLHPQRLGSDLTRGEAQRLRQAIVTVLERAIALRGSTIRNYVGGSGLQGQYQDEFRVYGRTGKPCPRCGTPIACVRLAGRSSHFCPACQPAAGHRRSSRTARALPMAVNR
jgi:formamidopyrimidine-DNA glycosylase